DAARLHHFLHQLVSDFKDHGLAKAPEIFPKQSDVRLCEKKLGNWLRVPGKHHKRPHWSRVWNGCEWLEGEQAVLHTLSLQGDPVGVLDAAMKSLGCVAQPAITGAPVKPIVAPPSANGEAEKPPGEAEKPPGEAEKAPGEGAEKKVATKR